MHTIADADTMLKPIPTRNPVKRLLALAVALVLCLPMTSQANAAADKVADKVVDKAAAKAASLESVFQNGYKEGSFHGNALVAEHGKIIYRTSLGFADSSSKKALNADSVFDIASISKQFTAIALLQLQKQGKLNLNDKLAKTVPELSFYDNITLLQLLHHTSGLPEYFDLFESHWPKQRIAVNQDVVDLLVKQRPAAEFKPGEKFSYTNTGYVLLALVIERVSGQSYGQYLQDNIFQPAGLKHTLVHRRFFQPRNIANDTWGHTLNAAGKPIPTPELGKSHRTWYLDGIVGDGMISSTANDLFQWDQVLRSERILSQADQATMASLSQATDKPGRNYQFGWATQTHPKYGRLATAQGFWDGYSLLMERQLDSNRVFIILQNLTSEQTKMPVPAVREILYN
ncbi:MAG: hypothetical protein RL748_2957 [Pseudomonadota bacterium]